ncbi:hypothetical protein Fmac_011906 [Flemingia macrophylla]|uniref:Uncharacterized protein n=1 Tax=Flemingia macrophylla TaxID=520843 RepID=A0ABD1MQW1_9FABA
MDLRKAKQSFGGKKEAKMDRCHLAGVVGTTKKNMNEHTRCKIKKRAHPYIFPMVETTMIMEFFMGVDSAGNPSEPSTRNL